LHSFDLSEQILVAIHVVAFFVSTDA
jgi:hypothetical protein